MKNSINVASIAGFDPSTGAGILADVKTILSIGANPYAVITANTIQTHLSFEEIIWIDNQTILKQLTCLIQVYGISHFKIGLIKDTEQLKLLVDCIYAHTSNPFIVWDPVLFSSTGFIFHRNWENQLTTLNKITVITPNAIEFNTIWPNGINHLRNNMQCSILLKGGHRTDNKGIDCLITHNGDTEIYGEPFQNRSRHGSGCVFSSALTAYHALGYDLLDAARKAKHYTEAYIMAQR